MHKQSIALMKREGVSLEWESRVRACEVMVDALRFHHVEVADLCVSARHWHALARFYPVHNEVWRAIRAEHRSQNRDPRHLMGIAKKESARTLSREGLAAPGGVWAAGCGRRFIKNQWHYKKVLEYIPDHAKQGAAVYSLLFPLK